MKKICLALFAVVLSLSIRAGAAELTVSITCDATPESITGFICFEFKRLVEEKTNGAIAVNVYPNGQMGSDKEVMENIISGEIEFAAMNSANQATDIPAVKIFDMFCLFHDLETARRAVDNAPFREKLLGHYHRTGLELLMISDQSFRETTSNKAVRNMDGFKGLNIRTMENPVHVAFWRALGANPTPMNRSEVFLSLQQGLLDAQEDPHISSFLNNYAEVQKYVIETHHLFHNVTLIANKRKFDALPADRQKAIRDACAEVLVSSRKRANEIGRAHV